MKYRGIHNPAVQEIIAAIDERYHEPSLSVKNLAAAVAMRPTAVALLFEKHAGVSVRDHLRNVRAQQAAALLTSGVRRIKDVWTTVGYNHASNFNHDFKHRFGMSPHEYQSRVIRSSASMQGHSVSPAEPVNRSAQTVAGRALRILIVDDDEGTRETVGCYLRNEGYVVSVAETAQSGLEIALRERPTAVLLDYHLPDSNGIECLQSLRRHDVSAFVFVFSADWDVEEREPELRQLGGVYLPKLCDLQDILVALAGVAR